MAELVDALDSGSSGKNLVQVQVLLSAPNKNNPNFLDCVIFVCTILSYFFVFNFSFELFFEIRSKKEVDFKTSFFL